MSRQVGFEEWGEPLPPTCDWRKAAGIISSVKNQVPAPTKPGPVQPVMGEGRWGKAQPPYSDPPPPFLP